MAEPTFAHDKMPRYDGPLDPDRGRITYEADCCTQRECEQRDYNRACLLALEKLSQAYAALRLVEWSTAMLWVCDDTGHTVDCPNEACQFGREMHAALVAERMRFSSVVTGFCKVLTAVAADLTPQWQEFYDAEQAGEMMEDIGRKVEAGAVPRREAASALRMCLDVWKQQVTGYDEIEYARWFRAPADGPPS